MTLGQATAWLVFLAAWLAGPPVAATPDYRLGASIQDGASLPVAAGLARLVSIGDRGFAVTEVAETDVAQTVAALAKGEIHFALVNGLAAFRAFAGAGDYGGRAVRELRAVSGLIPHAIHFLVHADQVRDATLGDVGALSGTLNLGSRFGDGRRITTALLEAVGIDVGTLRIGFRSHPEAVKALSRRLVAAVNADGVVPVAAATQAFAIMGPSRVRLLAVSEAELERLDWRFPGVWFAQTIAPGTYPGLNRPVRLPSLAQVIVARAEVPENDVHALVAAIFENLDGVRKIYPAAAGVSLATALRGLALLLHSGAARFYREQGRPVPERLSP